MAAIRTNACDGKGRRDKLIVLRHRRYGDLRCNLAGDTPDWLLGTWLSASRVLRNMVACAILAARLSCQTNLPLLRCPGTRFMFITVGFKLELCP
jgi:hypothetical protein